MNLGDRMKTYESVSKNFLTRKTPVIIRIDGRAFHTFTRGLDKPFSMSLKSAMWYTAKKLCESIQNAKLAYTQSDEISILLLDTDNIETEPWFGNNVQKLVSISASIATLGFNEYWCKNLSNINKVNKDKQFLATFDSRAFNIPESEVCNYFIWRQIDCTRNSIQSLGQKYFSHKQLQNKNCDEIQEMLFQEKGINWSSLKSEDKRGKCIAINSDTRKWEILSDTPDFLKDRDFIEKIIRME